MAGMPPWLNKGKANSKDPKQDPKNMSPRQAAIARRMQKNKGKK